MKYEVLSRPDQTEVVFSEGLGLVDHTAFRAMLGQVEQTSPEAVVFDFSGLETIQAAGLGLLLIAREQCHRAGRTLELRRPQGNVRRVLEAARLDRLMTIN